MRTRHLLITLAVATGLSGCRSSTSPFDYPASPRGTLVEDYHGQAVPDPYRWLEDGTAPTTRAWIEEQNHLTQGHLASLGLRDRVRDLVEPLWEQETFGLPERHGDAYYYRYNDGSLDQSLLVRSPYPGKAHEVVLDPNAFSSDGTFSLAGLSFSLDGRYLAYGISDGGSDWRTWYVRDLESGENLADRIEWTRFSTPAWLPDSSGFIYLSFPETEDPLTAPAGTPTLWVHQLGTPGDDDRLIHEDVLNPQRIYNVRTSPDGAYQYLLAREGTRRENMVWIRPSSALMGGWTDIFTAFDGQYRPVGNRGSQFWFWTDKDAPQGRVVRLDYERLEDGFSEVIGEGQPLGSAALVGDALILNYMDNAASRVRVHDLEGKLLRSLALPAIGTASGFEGRIGSAETFFTFSSYTTPPTIFSYDSSSGETSVVQDSSLPFASDQYETRLEFATSADGTRIPLYVTTRRGLEPAGDTPTLLYGYGGFNIPMRPRFSAFSASWLQLGGAYAVACLRGGGEFGMDWYRAGTLARKQNVFDDFIAAAEHLINHGLTRPERLAIRGGSNGGLLVGAVLNQRPELFGAALPAVGVMDMLRYQRFTIGRFWASDYGLSEDEQMFPHLLSYSPLHNARQGTSYPPVLVTTADRDDRVVPAHSFKYTAALQYAQAGSAPVLIRVETRAGHGAGKSRTQSISASVDQLTFLIHHLGLTLE